MKSKKQEARDDMGVESRFMAKIVSIQESLAKVLECTVMADLTRDNTATSNEHKQRRKGYVLRLQKQARELAGLHFVTLNPNLREDN